MNFVTPTGFRDIMPQEAAERENIVNRVQACFAARGFLPIETPTLELMDVMNAAGRIPGSPFKLFDAAGDLLALRPDVTVQVARMCATRLRDRSDSLKFRYTQRVFRESDTQAALRELTQIGLESIGEGGTKADVELVGLFAEALGLCELDNFTIALGNVSVLRDVLEKCPMPGRWKNEVLDAYHTSNFVAMDELLADSAVPSDFARAIGELPRLRGGVEVIEDVRSLVQPLGCDAGLDSLQETIAALEAQGSTADFMVDFSIMSSFDYYTGIVFEAYAPGLGSPLGSGGRYDSMLAAYDGVERPAAGFAFYLEQVMAARAKGSVSADRPLQIAVPKGSLAPDTLACLSAAGLDTTGLDDPGRTLIISNPGVDFIIVRPTDAPVFVAMGGADCGICGKDSLVEAGLDVVELTDLKFGACRFIVAQPEGATDQVESQYAKRGCIRVASKYPHITKAYYDKMGQQVEIVKLHGNIELAPLTGMAERIVDITATGTTLRENNLEIVDDVLASTARFFANISAFRTNPRVEQLAQRLQKNVKEN